MMGPNPKSFTSLQAYPRQDKKNKVSWFGKVPLCKNYVDVLDGELPSMNEINDSVGLW